MTKKTKSRGGTPTALKFNAGGRTSAPPTAPASTPSPRPRDIQTRGNKNTPDKHSNKTTMAHSRSNALTVLQTGLRRKRSPLHLQNWIACVLTLDGRDKFTKLLQYLSRFLSWYFHGLASSSSSATAIAAASTAAAASPVSTTQMQLLYSILSARFHLLYKSLVESRKAFRLGRSFIELDKLRSMGWGEYARFMLLHPLAGGVAGHMDHGGRESGEHRDDLLKGHSHEFGRYDTHPIDEGDEDSNCDEDDRDGRYHSNKDTADDGDGDDDGDDEASWNEEEDDDDDEDYKDRGQTGTNATHEEEKKWDGPETKEGKVESRPNRPILPSRISSNIGWGPATTTTVATTAASAAASSTSTTAERAISEKNTSMQQQQQNSLQSHPSPPKRTVSEIGRQMYRPFPSRSSSMGSYKQVREPSSSASLPTPPTTPTIAPTWKLVGGTLKLLGLMGFWACDNIAFLTGSGFLDPISLTTSSSSSSSSSSLTKETRMTRKAKASAWGARCYFVASIAGLVVNFQEVLKHRSGALRNARWELSKRMMVEIRKDGGGDGEEEEQEELEKARAAVKYAEGKHFELYLALLKSLCDFMVFSNNPGVDLHLKLRGRKNHEGLHCLGGLISASTVLYNNFPNAAK